jgi:hypothetical protein
MGQKISRKAGEVSASFASLLSSVVCALPPSACHRFSQRQPPPQPHIGSNNIPPYTMSPAICWLLSYSLI